MKSVLNRLFLVSFLAGIVVGPGYLIYCTHFSGKEVMERPIFSYDVTPVSVRGWTPRSVKDEEEPIKPVALPLSPEMNPVGVNISGHYIPPLRRGTDRRGYGFRLSRNKDVLWEDSLLIEGRGKELKKGTPSIGDIQVGNLGMDKFSFNVTTVSVPEPGDYQLSVRSREPSELHVTDMKVVIRRNTTVANRLFVRWGCAALGMGFAGLFTIGIINKKRKAG